jgi:O-antigen ligase
MPYLIPPAQAQKLKARAEHAPVAWGMFFLSVLLLVAVGRVQEFIPAFASIRLGMIAGGLALLAWILSPGGLRQKVPLDSKPVRYVLGLLVLAVVTVPIGVWPGHSFEYLFGKFWKTVLIFLLVLYWCRTIKDIRKMVWICGICSVSLVAGGVLTGEMDARLFSKSLSYDPNDLALLLVMIIPLTVYLLQTVRPTVRVLVLAMLLVNLYGVVLTKSRGGFLALLVAGGLMMWRGSWSRSTKVVIVTVSLLVFSAVAGKSYWERIATIWDPKTEYDRTAGGRTDLWKTGLTFMATRPWGVGIDGFVIAEGLSHGRGKWSAPHNSFLQVGVELGVAGLALFVLLLKHTMKALRRMQTGLHRALKRRVALRFTHAASHDLARARSGPSPPPATDGRLHTRQDLAPLATALEISLWAFLVGGFFLSQAYDGLLYTVLALSLACVRLDNEVIAAEKQPVLRMHPLDRISQLARPAARDLRRQSGR